MIAHNTRLPINYQYHHHACVKSMRSDQRPIIHYYDTIWTAWCALLSNCFAVYNVGVILSLKTRSYIQLFANKHAFMFIQNVMSNCLVDSTLLFMLHICQYLTINKVSKKSTEKITLCNRSIIWMRIKGGCE